MAHRWARAYGRPPHEFLYLDPLDATFDTAALLAGADEDDSLVKAASKHGALRLVKVVH